LAKCSQDRVQRKEVVKKAESFKQWSCSSWWRRMTPEVVELSCVNVDLWRVFRTRLIISVPLRMPRFYVTERFFAVTRSRH
jgi:hypothetical protein